jgi:ubiquinone biosynthesis O-methyltransferase
MVKKTITQEQSYYEKYWNNVNEGGVIFEDVPFWEEKELIRVKNLIGDKLKGKILDVGCGNGAVAIYLSKQPSVKEVIGIDISSTAVEICRKAARKAKNETVKFQEASVTELPFKNQAFDTIYSFEVIEHIIDVSAMLKECNRVLKKGGFFAMSTVELNFIKRILVSVFLFEKYFSPHTPHIRFFTKRSLQQLLEDHGFEVIKYGWTNSYFKIIPMGQMVLAKKVKNI